MVTLAVVSFTASVLINALIAALIVGIIAYLVLLVLARLGLAVPLWIAGVLALLAFLLVLVGG